MTMSRKPNVVPYSATEPTRVLPRKGIAGLVRSIVNGKSRVPKPAAKIIAFIAFSSLTSLVFSLWSLLTLRVSALKDFVGLTTLDSRLVSLKKKPYLFSVGECKLAEILQAVTIL